MSPLFLPSPAINGFDLGPVRIHFYAVFILIGIAVAWWLSAKRWRERGGRPEALEGVVIWAIPAGIVGARAYHVLTHIDDYFGPGIDPFTVLYLWQGGLGIMGCIGLGAVGAWIGARREKVSFATVADVLAPGIVFAQAIGRLGNYFNQELFGVPSSLPWAVEISMEHRPYDYVMYETFHPTFLYEMLWNIAVGFLLLWLDRRFKMGYGKLFVSYVALYCVGRLGIELLRIDPSGFLFGIRNHQFIAGIILLVSLAALLWMFKYRPGREPDMGAVEAFSDEHGPDDGPTGSDESTSETSGEDSKEHGLV